MSITISPLRAPEADEVFALLRANGLPLDGLDAHLHTTLVARSDGRLVGSAALEVYEDGALLRSVAVDELLRGHHLGAQLTEAALQLARERQLPAVYLLTTTADSYFPRFGFERITREDVPPGVTRSLEFTSACPASAVVMRKRLSQQ